MSYKNGETRELKYDETTRLAAQQKLYDLEMLRKTRPSGLLTEDEINLKAILLEAIEAEQDIAQHIRKDKD